MSLPFRPSIQFGESEVFLFQLPLLPWTERSDGIGGHAVSAAGIPEAYVIRTDRIAQIRLRVLEEELPSVLALMEEIRNGAREFTFRFDQDDAATEADVYLHAPVWPAPVTPTRDDSYRALFQIAVEIRRSDGAAFDLSWTEVESES